MRRTLRSLAILGALAAGFAWGQDDGKRPSEEERARLKAEAEAKLKHVRREVKEIDFETALQRIPAFVAREKEYLALVQRIRDAATGGGGDTKAMLQQAREMKVTALDDLNGILKLHRGKFVDLAEEEVRARFEKKELRDLHYREEWVVNILDEVEEQVGINVEVDARVYKFDVVTYDFEKTSARAMLRTIGDNLGFKWAIRGDTLYVYKEFNEILFDDEWLKQQRAIWKAKQEAKAKATAEAEEKAKKEKEKEAAGQ